MIRFLDRICLGLGFNLEIFDNEVLVDPKVNDVEKLLIPRIGFGCVKTFEKEPITSIYLLILYSLSSFGLVKVWED
ncbi:hypothetical protein PNA2_1920 [Pyrococcus sp. NA2]|nr:hypothetical protein PNA2_1920 [Pyrococcus sp. NA2]